MSWDPLLPEQEDWPPVQASTLAAMGHCLNTANLTLWFGVQVWFLSEISLLRWDKYEAKILQDGEVREVNRAF